MRATIALLIAVVGCSGSDPTFSPPPPDGPLNITLETDRLSYSSSVGGNATIRNLSGVPVHHGGCRLDLERRVNGSWVGVWMPPVPCPAVLQQLEPGATINIGFQVSAAPQSGRYRLVRRFWPPDQPYDNASFYRSNEFLIVVN